MAWRIHKTCASIVTLQPAAGRPKKMSDTPTAPLTAENGSHYSYQRCVIHRFYTLSNDKPANTKPGPRAQHDRHHIYGSVRQENSQHVKGGVSHEFA